MNHLLTPRDWQAQALREAQELLGTPEGAAKLVEAKRYGMLADEIERLSAARDAAFEECIKAITGQIDLTDLDLGEQSEKGMYRALEIVQAAKKGTT